MNPYSDDEFHLEAMETLTEVQIKHHIILEKPPVIDLPQEK